MYFQAVKQHSGGNPSRAQSSGQLLDRSFPCQTRSDLTAIRNTDFWLAACQFSLAVDQVMLNVYAQFCIEEFMHIAAGIVMLK